MKTKILLLLAIASVPFLSNGQDISKKETTEKEAVEKEKNQKVKLNLSGFVKGDFFFDTRQTTTAREGHLLLWPNPVEKDPDGNDINAKSSFNFLAVQSRVALKIKGPDAYGAKISGKIEADFFGQANSNINLLRLRHAFVKMKWENTELLFGQHWIPMFIADCSPGVISFNTGMPLQPFGMNPQIRLTKTMKSFKFIAMASSQRDFASRTLQGPSGEYLSNSTLPELSTQLHFNSKKIFAGLGVSYKQITPQIETDKGYATKQTVNSLNYIAFLKIKNDAITLKMEGIYGQNMADVISIGGFGITDTTNVAKGFVNYTPTTTLSAWTDISTNTKKVQVGLFAGYTKNLGANKEVLASSIAGLGTNIESLFRVAPRVVFNSGNVRFAFETEYTSANFGSSFNSKAVPTDLTRVNNLRLLLGVYYFF